MIFHSVLKFIIICCFFLNHLFVDATNLEIGGDKIKEQADKWLQNEPVKQDNGDSHVLHPDFNKIFRALGHRQLEIFCYPGEPQSFLNILKTVELVLKVPNDNYEYYQGQNSSAVKSMKADASWLNFNPWRPTSFKMDLYGSSCVGIETAETYKASLTVRYLDLWRVLVLSAGVCLFLLAPLFANNSIFHYATGVSVGVCGSLLVIVFLISRLMPKKTGAATILVGGWGLVLYVLQYLWSNCISLMKEHQSIVLGYVVTASLISFAVVYRYGPIKDSRSLHLVKWALQMTGLLLIFASSDCKEFTVAVAIILLAHHNLPQAWLQRWNSLWFRYFPPKPSLLTEEQYMEQSRIETKKALEDLRNFCNSPDCNAWKTMSKLKTPQRFAEFVGGDSHLMDDEILSYEVSDFQIPDDGVNSSDTDPDEW